MRMGWSRRHSTTIVLVAGALAALILLGQARVIAAGPAGRSNTGVVATHSVAAHTAPWAALRSLRSRTGPPRSGQSLGAPLSGIGLGLALLLALAGAAGRRRPVAVRGPRTADVRGPPQTTAC
ncbi:MAG TPA: hypothetical protein VGJ07_33565 [Rugosimonospora sp.]